MELASDHSNALRGHRAPRHNNVIFPRVCVRAETFAAARAPRVQVLVRSRGPRKLVVKGMMDAQDPRLACEAGADAIVVSNCGGRQLDGAPSSISMLPEIAAGVGGRGEVLFDGGIQSGEDALKTLARRAHLPDR